MADTLETLLGKLKGWHKSVKDKAEDIGDEGTPTARDKADVNGWLDDAESDIDVILDPNQSPSLDPPSAGSAQTVTIPSSRLQTCEDALDLAEEAYNEMLKPSPNYTTIGDDIRTLKASYIGAINGKFGIE